MELDLDFSAKLGISLDNLTSAVRTFTAEQLRLHQYPRQLPLFFQNTQTPTDFKDFGSPANGRIWEIRELLVLANTNGSTGGWVTLPNTTNIQASNTFAGAAGGSVSLPAGASITGFTVAFQAPVAAVSGTLTITNATGGTISYDVTIPTTGLIFSENFPGPIPATSSAAQITFNVPVIAGGPPYSITLTGQQTVGSGITATFWVGPNVSANTVAPGILPTGLTRWQFTNIPAVENLSADQILVRSNEHLMASLTGLPALTTPVTMIAVINDVVTDGSRAVTIGA